MTGWHNANDYFLHLFFWWFHESQSWQAELLKHSWLSDWMSGPSLGCDRRLIDGFLELIWQSTSKQTDEVKVDLFDIAVVQTFQACFRPRTRRSCWKTT